MMKPLYQHLATLIHARQVCKEKTPPNNEWFVKHGVSIVQLANSYLPSGSGLDVGTAVNLERSTHEKLVLETGFHHMDEHGYSTMWTDHTVIVTPSLMFGLNLRVTGQDKNGIKEHLHQVFEQALMQQLNWDAETQEYTARQ